MTDNQSGGSYKLDADLSQPIDWEEAMAELERDMPQQKTPAPATTPAPVAMTTPAPVATRKQPERDPATPHDGLAEILTAVNTAMNSLKKFEEKYPYLIAPNIYRSWEESLRESSLVLMREFRRVRPGTEDDATGRKGEQADDAPESTPPQDDSES